MTEHTRRRRQDLGDRVCCALLLAAFMTFVLLLVPYVLRMPALTGVVAA